MALLKKIHKLWDHILWADDRILEAVRRAPEKLDLPDARPHTDLRREFAHILGSEENWLARLQHRTPLAPVWPELSPSGLDDLVDHVHRGYAAYFRALTESDLSEEVTYLNSKGQGFTNEVGDILMHVALHGQYHRGKINLLLRLAGEEPAPTDYIAFLRGVPAATTR